MARLSAKKRRSLPKSSFVYPASRAYPIHDRAHAKAALSLSARKDTKGSYSKVRAAVKRRYPDLVSGGSRSGTTSKRKSSKRSSRSTSRRRR